MEGGWTETRVREIKGTEKKIKGLFDAVHHDVREVRPAHTNHRLSLPPARDGQ